jgi:hypothetical protein
MTNQISESQEPTTEVVDQAETGLAVGEESAVEASQPEEAPVEPEYDYFDPTEVGEKYVKVKVDGEEISVPLNEALQGYQRQADYTKKTQELAVQRQEAENALRLAQSVQANPGLTMQVLASQAGMSVEQFLNLTPAQQQQVAADSEPEYSDPFERALAEERQARMALEAKIEQREADEILHRAIGGLQQQLGATEEDVRAVVGQALQMGVGPEMFPMIYQSQQYQKSLAIQQAQTQSQQQTAAAEQQRQAAARQAAQVVGSGSGVVGTTPAQVAGQPMTAAEAAAAALESLGVA